MNKSVRITLYVLSLLTVGVIIWALIFGGKGGFTGEAGGGQMAGNMSAEEGTDGNTDGLEESGAEIVTGTETMAEENTDEENAEEVTLLFAGDVLIQASLTGRYDKEGITSVVSEEVLAAMQGADIMMVNHEFQFSTRGEPMEDKQFTFETDPKYVQVLLDLGVDIVSLANNHSLDFGQDALLDTMATLDSAGILHAGAGETKERAEALQIIEVNGKKFGFLAATRVIPVSKWNVEYGKPGLFATYDETRLLERIEESKAECDFLTVYVHWGIERVQYPKAYQRTLAERYFTAGADLVIGAHPHVLQGIEMFGDKPVFYSLGNYIFGNRFTKTMLVEVKVSADGDVAYRLIPAFAEDGKTELYEGEEAQALYDYLTEISANVKVESDGGLSVTEPKDITYEHLVPPATETTVTETTEQGEAE